VLLCSSVFPFRLPRDTWEHRLRLVRESGYRMVDLYVHWGFHEPTEGEIDLVSPERDLAAFLDLCAEQEMLVMARPGPYICSETDGGGLPGWLHGDRGGRGPIRLRGTDPEYLAAVDRWFAAVLPVLAAAQTTRGGPVALVQIENELDFLDCPDAPEYMAHLAETARTHGIDVPIIACAGQGDAAGATGEADGVVPTFNLYPDDATPFFEPEVRHYAAQVAGAFPLMVTETNRLHRTLRREILGGARLVAPYLQTGGFNHLVQPSAGNWGDPGNLMTYDYDFGGYVSPDGRRTAEFAEARKLSASLAAWGALLAVATPVPIEDTVLEAADEPGPVPGGALALPGGGTIVGPAELTGSPRRLRLGEVTGTLEAGTCPFWCADVPTSTWGVVGALTATAELRSVSLREAAVTLEFVGTADAQVRIVAPGGTVDLDLKGPGEAEIRNAERTLTVRLREEETSTGDPAPEFHPAALEVGPFLLPEGEDRGRLDGPAPQAETLGATRGRVRTAAAVPAGTRELVLLGAGDLIRVVADGNDRGLSAPHGGPVSVPLDPGEQHDVDIVTEIWGHANFDDSRLPALRIGSGRGPGTVLAVDEVRDVSANWTVTTVPTTNGGVRRDLPPLRVLGGWSSTRGGEETVYERDLDLTPTSEANGRRRAALRLVGLTRPVKVNVDGADPELLSPGTNVLPLPADATQVHLAVRAPHTPDGLGRAAELLLGSEVTGWDVRVLSPEDVAAALESRDDATEDTVDAPGNAGTPVNVPVSVEPGEPVRVTARIPGPNAGRGLLLHLDGTNVQLTVVHQCRVVSRHVLADHVATSGGDPHRSWLPASWIAEARALPEADECVGDGQDVLVDVLVEAATAERGELTSLTWAPAAS
jgi:hypothetical protein